MRTGLSQIILICLLLSSPALRGYYNLSGSDKKYIERLLRVSSQRAYDFIGSRPAIPPRVLLVKDWDELKRPHVLPPPEWGIAIAIPQENLIILKERSFTITEPGLQQVLTHEFIHIATYHRAGGEWLPAWFNEGLAQMGSGETRFKARALLALSAWRRKIYSLHHLEYQNNFTRLGPSFAYAASLSAVELLSKEFGHEILLAIIDSTRSRESFEEGFATATGHSLNSFYWRWQKYIRKKYRFFFITSSNQIFWTLVALLFMLIGIWKWVATRRRLKRLREKPPTADEKTTTYNRIHYPEPPSTFV